MFNFDTYFYIFDVTHEKCLEAFTKLINIGYLNIDGYYATEGKEVKF